jgi:hypothetical protein
LDQEHQSAPELPTVTIAEWKYAGSGYLHGEKYWADIAHARIQTARAIRRRATERDEQQEAS